MAKSLIVETENLNKQYEPPDGEFAVKGVSFDIQRGEVFSLLGPNGAGKSTTISMLSGLFPPTSGDALVDGYSILKDKRAVKSVIGVVPQEIALYPTLTAAQNLAFWGKMYGLSGSHLQDRIGSVLKVAGLEDRAADKVDTYSGGMKRRLNIAVGLLHSPKILYMDEPTVGIDPQSRRRILDTIKELNNAGMSVLYTTHYMEEAEELSDRIGIIDHGELIAIGSQDELTKTVGSSDVIQVQYDSMAAPDELQPGLTQLQGIKQVAVENNDMMLEVEEANDFLPAFIAHASENNIRIRGIDIQEPNLEAVFLHLTGRALRD